LLSGNFEHFIVDPTRVSRRENKRLKAEDAGEGNDELDDMLYPNKRLATG